ncbi:dermonecrotic toxin domain-containing protein [Pseudomonas typographi]|uniref:Dermonecrotic toxin N-terminal domain-containing protein n=1 Tax=Pseudomonas typographi TaxID=2715964 RepID=A0ABR7Z729_9PSED|nr:DUF6543 domain-containing protein [Pseudomonas typographi]MBD1601217.1 hypothetical protein [Pseudomonas typographi]
MPETATAWLHHWWAEPEGAFSRRGLLRLAYLDGLYQALFEARGRICQGLENSQRLLTAYAEQSAVETMTLVFPLGEQFYPVAGSLIWRLAGVHGCWLYLPTAGLSWFASVSEALSQLAQKDSPAVDGLGTTARRLWSSSPVRALRTVPASGMGIDAVIESLLAVQRANVEDVLEGLNAGIPDAEGVCLFDDALDLRRRIDPRLARLDPARRWSEVYASNVPAPFNPRTIPTKAFDIVERLMLLRAIRIELSFAHPTAEDVASDMLTPLLSVFDLALNPAYAVMHYRQGDGPPRDITLPQLLLERVSGASPGPLAPDTRIGGGAHSIAPGLSVALLDYFLDVQATRFDDAYAQQFETVFKYGHRLNQRWVSTAQVMSDTLENLLLIELEFARRARLLPEPLLELLDAALDGSPSVQAFGLDVGGRAELPMLRLLNVLVLCRRPVAEANAPLPLAAGPVLFWSAATGLAGCERFSQVRDGVARALRSHDYAQHWYQAVCVVDRLRLKASPLTATGQVYTVTPWHMQGGALHRLGKSTYGRQHHEALLVLAQARAERFPAALFATLLDMASGIDSLGEGLGRLTKLWTAQQATELLPQWWLQASVPDRQVFIDYLTDCSQAAGPAQDYLEGLPSLEAFARDRVQKRLVADGMGQLDPDRITVQSRVYVPAPVALGNLPSAITAAVQMHSETLSAWALQHWDWVSATVSLHPAGNEPLPAALSTVYVRNLVRELDCGRQYRRLLDEQLGPASPLLHMRQGRFYRQMRRQMLMGAWAQKLDGTLGKQGFDWVERVVQLPDTTARNDAGLADVAFTQMTLSAAADQVPDKVHGLYLIGRPGQPGAVVLFGLYITTPPFRRFDNMEALQAAIRSEAPLQALILERLAPDRRTVYDNGGFNEPHLRWSVEDDFFVPWYRPRPIKVCFDVLPGNVLAHLYSDNLVLLKAMAAAQCVTSQEGRWRDLRYLLTLALEQGSMFLPVPFALVIGAWQSEQLAVDALAALQGRHWGQALSELVAAMSSLMPMRAGMAAGWPRLPAGMGFSWQQGALPAALARRLLAFEVSDAVLSQMPKDTALGLYTRAGDHYASVEGKVFQVRLLNDQWRIVDAKGRRGPAVMRDAQSRWRLDWTGLRGGSPVEGQLPVRLGNLTELNSLFDMRYEGLAQIRAANISQAVDIETGLQQAQRYLDSALQKLPANGQLPARVQRVLRNTFGPDALGNDLVQALREKIESVYEDANSVSLRDRDGSRWVTGVNKLNKHDTLSFVVPDDPLRRLYLTEQFFDGPMFPDISEEAARAGFDVRLHHRAAVILHELTHVNTDSVDIAYLEANSPFVDLLHPHLPVVLLNRLAALRGSLTYATPSEHLFRSYDHGRWLDWNADEVATSAIDRVFQLTGTQNLDKAREVFLANPVVRRALILSNADSLTWLIISLGRDVAPGG